MDPARMFKESLTSRPELENSLGHKQTWRRTVGVSALPPRTDFAGVVYANDRAARFFRAHVRGVPHAADKSPWRALGSAGGALSYRRRRGRAHH